MDEVFLMDTRKKNQAGIVTRVEKKLFARNHEYIDDRTDNTRD